MTLSIRSAAFAGLGIITLQALVLWLLGQPILCDCGVLKFWEGVVLGPGNSQQLTDWYSFSHIIHGFIFYALLWLAFPRIPIQVRLLLALGIEVAWEVLENTPWIINIYRQQALAAGYVGDSILNSLSDTVMAALGFVLAWRLPVWSIVLLAVAFELWVGYAIHDNLTLNIIGFFYSSPALDAWQAAGVQ